MKVKIDNIPNEYFVLTKDIVKMLDTIFFSLKQLINVTGPARDIILHDLINNIYEYETASEQLLFLVDSMKGGKDENI